MAAGLLDYLHLGFTNATAFSPTDVMPLTLRAKYTMVVQASVALALFGLIVARREHVRLTVLGGGRVRRRRAGALRLAAPLARDGDQDGARQRDPEADAGDHDARRAG